MPGLQPTVPEGAKLDARNLYLARRDQALAAPRFLDREVHVNGGAFSFDNPILRGEGALRLLNVGDLAPADLTIRHGWLEGAGIVPFTAGRTIPPSIRISPGCSLTLLDSRVENMPSTAVAFMGARLRIEECWFGPVGLGSLKGDHLEAVFVHCGEAVIARTAFDLRVGAGRIQGGWTGVLFFSGRAGPITARVDGCRIEGVKACAMAYAIQVTGPHPVELTIANTAIEAGTSGKYIGVTPGPAALRIIDGGGNTDLETGKPVDLGRVTAAIPPISTAPISPERA